MVIICDKTYNEQFLASETETMQEHFNTFPFPLSDFQKYAIHGIVANHHVLITAHTGSGKTLPAEFAIRYFCGKGKKIIYTSPIKALSNEKYYDFKRKFPDISVGILTGDIKFNPDAELIIMTTEILQNHLYKRNQKEQPKNAALSFDMNIDEDLACVVFDEVHYINDLDRGKVWEETILMLPEHVSMVMLSATIDNPEKFASWCENRYQSENAKKVILAGTTERVVPLKHYLYTTSTEHLFKVLKDKDKEREIKTFLGKPILFKEGGKIKDEALQKTNKLLTLMNNKHTFVKPAFVLNSLIRYLFQNNMLPAICFVFSRNNVEKYAGQINVNLFTEEESHVPTVMFNECDKIIRNLPNYDEYKELPEYLDLVAIMQKGVAIHHSGMMPILREMVEMIFAKGYIKVLFATETFAVGINMPTKTVIFTAMNKFTSQGHRSLLSHEYTQMAGRAGRRGLDTVGHVIHCNNIFREQLSLMQYKTILSGKPQVLQSKFQISYALLLNLIALNRTDFYEYVESSMLRNEIDRTIDATKKELETCEKDIRSYETSISINNIDEEVLEDYITKDTTLNTLNGNKRKKMMIQLKNIEDNYGKQFQRDMKIVNSLQLNKMERSKILDHIKNAEMYVRNQIDAILSLLCDHQFVVYDDDNSIYSLTPKGKMASCIHECNAVIMSEIIDEGIMNDMSEKELVAFLSCFTNVSVSDDEKLLRPPLCKNICDRFKEKMNFYMDFENDLRIDITSDEDFHYDLMEECLEWCSAEDEASCKMILDKLKEKSIFVGDFVKAILKINNVVNELTTACEYSGNIPLMEKLSHVSDITLKYVVLQLSLYI